MKNLIPNTIILFFFLLAGNTFSQAHLFLLRFCKTGPFDENNFSRQGEGDDQVKSVLQLSDPGNTLVPGSCIKYHLAIPFDVHLLSPSPAWYYSVFKGELMPNVLFFTPSLIFQP